MLSSTNDAKTINELRADFRRMPDAGRFIFGRVWDTSVMKLLDDREIGPTYATWMSKHSMEAAEKFPPLVSLTLSYTYIHTNATEWKSENARWDYDREKNWGAGEKDALKGQLLLSFLRLGAPLQAYVSYRNQSWIPGRNTRPANTVATGVRLLLKFW